MLVLTREIGERIVITSDGVEIIVQLVGRRGKHVRVGITAPPEVVVLREELVDGMRRVPA